MAIGNEGSTQLGSHGSGPVPKGETPVGNPATQPTHGSGPLTPTGGSGTPVGNQTK